MRDQRIRILNIANMNSDSGVACFLMNYLRAMDMKKFRMDFVCWDKREDNCYAVIKKMGGRVFLVTSYKKNAIRFLAEIRKIVKQGGYDIIHGHEAIMSLPALWYGKKYKVPVRIAHSHSVGMTSPVKELIASVSRHAFERYCTDVMACSKMAGDYLFGDQVFQERGQVLHNAIRTEEYAFQTEVRERLRRELGADKELVIGHVGRFNENKNHKFLVDVFEKVLEKEKDALLLLIGEGETMDDVKKQVSEKGMERQVRFLGIKKNVNEWLQAMDVFAFPSFAEGLGIVLIEAQAAGLPCCCTDTIPGEAKCSENMVFLSLNEKKDVWAETLLDMRVEDRVTGTQNVRNAGYDVLEEANKLERFYVKASAR